MKNFSVLIKPASSNCNMRCVYCFYDDVSNNREIKSYGIMDEDTAKAVIEKSMLQLGDRGTMNFSFQGGEPTVAGLPFFEMFCTLVDTMKPERMKVSYSIQTNGLVIDENWCAFFKKHNFLVGISLDGTLKTHDFLRPDHNGGGTGAAVLSAINLMRRQKIDFNILSVVTKQLAKHAQQVFEFYKKNKFDFVQFIPCLPSLGEPENMKVYTLTPKIYAAFLKQMFKLWRGELINGRYISIRLFDNLTQMITGKIPEQCGIMGFCQPQFVVEADGGIYPCDFYVLDKYHSGNVKDITFEAAFNSAPMQNFLNEKAFVSPLCGECNVKKLCGGGCKRYRSFYFSEEDYCPNRDFLQETYPEFRRIAASLINN